MTAEDAITDGRHYQLLSHDDRHDDQAVADGFQRENAIYLGHYPGE